MPSEKSVSRIWGCFRRGKGTSFIPDERFKTDSDALGAALADFENEPIEDFLG